MPYRPLRGALPLYRRRRPCLCRLRGTLPWHILNLALWLLLNRRFSCCLKSLLARLPPLPCLVFTLKVLYAVIIIYRRPLPVLPLLPLALCISFIHIALPVAVHIVVTNGPPVNTIVRYVVCPVAVSYKAATCIVYPVNGNHITPVIVNVYCIVYTYVSVSH